MKNPHLTVITGPPQTGKSIYAQALAARLQMKPGNNILVLDGAEISNIKEVYSNPVGHRYGKKLVTYTHLIFVTNQPITFRREPGLWRRTNVIVRTSIVR